MIVFLMFSGIRLCSVCRLFRFEMLLLVMIGVFVCV